MIRKTKKPAITSITAITGICLLAAALLLPGCAGTQVQNPEEPAEAPASEEVAEVSADSENALPEDADAPAETDAPASEPDANRVYAVGPYGRISVELPEDWEAEVYAAGSEWSSPGLYGMHLHPESEETGYIDLNYTQAFGVCGTGLSQETVTLAGEEASVGTYDDHEMWNFISFRGALEHITVQSVMAEEWPEADREAVMTILDTVQFEPDVAEGAAAYFVSDSEIPEIGLIAEAKEITATGAVIRFRVWDPELSSGELQYGDDYTLERLEQGSWTPVPVVFEGEWAVNDIAYIIPKEGNPDDDDPANDSGISEWKVDWEWLYGPLTPGDYRIEKTVMDFRGTGDYDTYPVRAYFHYAGE